MPYIRGDINLATELRRQRPRLFSAPLRIVYAPQRHKTISTIVYHPQTHLDEPGIFLTMGTPPIVRMTPDQLDSLIQHLTTHRDALVNAYSEAVRLSTQYGLAIKHSNSGLIPPDQAPPAIEDGGPLPIPGDLQSSDEIEDHASVPEASSEDSNLKSSQDE